MIDQSEDQDPSWRLPELLVDDPTSHQSWEKMSALDSDFSTVGITDSSKWSAGMFEQLASSLTRLPQLRKDQLGERISSLNLLLSKFTIMMTFWYTIKTRVHKQEQVIWNSLREEKQ
jgi:hypothetical protein